MKNTQKSLEKTVKKEIFCMAVTDNSKDLDDVFNVNLDNKEAPTYNDLYLIERLSSAFLDEQEICAILKISRYEFDERIAFRAAFERGREMGKASLRRLQWKSAQSNPVMQIWLGKQYLGQADKLETTKGEDKSAAFKRLIDKLKNVIDVSPAGTPSRPTGPNGEGSSQVLLAPMGTTKPTGTNQARLVEPSNDTGPHSRVEEQAEESGKGILRKLEDMVASGGKRIREDS